MTFAVLKKQTYKVSFFNTVRDYTDEETPCSIPNQEAKLIMADDTIPYWDGERRSLRTLLLFFILSFLNHLFLVFLKLLIKFLNYSVKNSFILVFRIFEIL